MFFGGDDFEAGDGESTPDLAPFWRSPIAPYLKDSGVPLEVKPDPAPRRPPDNRRYRRDQAHGRTFWNRTRKGGYFQWHGAWPPVWHWDCVPFLRMRRAISVQSTRWAGGVVVVSLATGDDVWTVTLPAEEMCPSRGDRRGHRKDRSALFRARVGWTHRERQAAVSRSALLSRRHISVQPTNAP